MMFWKIFYQLKGAKGLNEAIENRDIKDITNFLKVYLDRPFDSNDEECFKIFFFICDNVKNKEEYELCESLMIGSRYFETMSGEKVIDALDEFISINVLDWNTEKFSKYLISKITDSKILLEYHFWYIAILYGYYSGLGFEDKLLELGVDYIIKLSEELASSNNKKLLAFCKQNLSLEEIEKLCRDGNFTVSDIFDNILQNYDNSELDILFNIMINKKEYRHSVIDTKRKRKVTVFEQFLDELNRREKITEQHKNYLAEKLLESKRYPKMLDFIANVECDANKKLIDELVGKVPDFILLYTLNNKEDIIYAVSGVLDQGNMNKFGFPMGDTLFSNDYEDIDKTNLILDTLFDLEPNIKFSKDIVIKLLKKGVNKFPVLINEYQLTEEERLEVLQALRESNSDWLIIYGNYLVIGNYMAKTSEKVANKQMARIRNLKSIQPQNT